MNRPVASLTDFMVYFCLLILHLLLHTLLISSSTMDYLSIYSTGLDRFLGRSFGRILMAGLSVGFNGRLISVPLTGGLYIEFAIQIPRVKIEAQ